MISQNTIQQILSRIDIVEIVTSFIKLKKRGTSYLGLCPFHNEKTPSFTVSPSKEIYKCFGCGRSGNSVSFLMEHEKYSYVEALRWLANKYNVEIEETETSPEYKQQQQVADSLYIINNFAQKFFSNALLNTDDGQDIALSYLKQRGFREEIIKKFQLGFNPETRDAFTKEALAAQYSLELLQKSGLTAVRDGNGYDNYRGRIIFPIHNQSGKVLGFGARIIKNNDKAPKYINTPENEIYVKSKLLYGSYFARMAIDKADECLLVEGYTDVISLHQAGIENVVASGGTSLTPDQLRLIKKYTNNLTIIYDGDNAGIKAALRGLDLALEESLNVRLVLIPDKEDPDSYVNKVGAAAFTQFIADNKKDVILFQLEIALKDAGTDTNKKSQVVNQIAETISRINKAEDFTKQQDYIKQCAEILKIEENGLYALVNKILREKYAKIESRANTKEEVSQPELSETIIPEDISETNFGLLFQDKLQEESVVRALLEYGTRPWDNNRSVSDYILDEEKDLFTDEMFEDKDLLLIIDEYRGLYKSGKQIATKDFAYHSNPIIANRVISITNFPYEYSKKWYEFQDSGAGRSKIWSLPYENFILEVKRMGDSAVADYETEYEDSYKQIASDSIVYTKLHKIKKMILQNEKDMQLTNDYTELQDYMKTHLHLKEYQIELVKKKQMVIFPVDIY